MVVSDYRLSVGVSLTSVREGGGEETFNCGTAAAAEAGNGRAVQVIRMTTMMTVDSMSRMNGNHLAHSLNGVLFQKPVKR